MATLWVKTANVIQKINATVCNIGMYVLIPMMVLTSIDVMGRAFLARPINGSIEISEYMLVVLIMSGLGYTEQQKGNVKVDFIMEKLPAAYGAVIDVLTSLVSVIVIGIVIWQGWVMAMKETTVSYMLRIPQAPFRLMVSIGCFFLLLELLVGLVKSCDKLFRRSR